MTKRLVGMISAALILCYTFNLSIPTNPTVSHAERENTSIYLPPVVGNGQSAGNPSTQPTPTPSPTPEATFPTLEEFVSQIASGNGSDWRGLYAAEKFTARIVQQPSGNYSFISAEQDMLTQYMLAEEDVVGLLAHNTQAGQYYFLLSLGDSFYLVADDTTIQLYQVQHIDRYQALQPNSNTSDYKNLETGEILTTAQIFA